MISKKIKSILGFLYVLSVIGFNPSIYASAQVNLLNENLSGAPGVDFTIDKVLKILLGISCWLSRTAIVVIVGALVVYAFLFFKSQGNPNTLKEAKTAMKWGLIGMVVIFGVYTIIKSVADAVGASISPSWLPLSCP